MSMFVLKIILNRVSRRIISKIACYLYYTEYSDGCCRGPAPFATGLRECEIAYRERDILSEIMARTDVLMEQKRLYLNPDMTLTND